ncbi:MAG: ABC transporter substrate-binding protein [Gemmataceae bacterium]|nr:ABC transporter substrate-binding protein [Gemmataceae bacterium]MDW8263815.1 ABC transporter substrate-binding protein [Gemmataceae bacterium]
MARVGFEHLWLRWLLILVPLGGVVLGLAGQETPRKPVKKEEEEEPVRPRPKVVVVPDDDGPAARPPVAAPADLAEEAKQASHPEVRDLYRSLVEPLDVIHEKSSSYFVRPVGPYLGRRIEFPGLLRVSKVLGPGKPDETALVAARSIEMVEHYEERALQKVERFLKMPLDRETPDSPKYLARSEMLVAAERALTVVLRFHESARERGVRAGASWEEVHKAVRARLLAVQLEQLDRLADAHDWPAGLELAHRLQGTYPGEATVRAAVLRLRLRQLEHALQRGQDADFVGVRQQLDRLENDLLSLGGADAEGVRRRADALGQRLTHRARELWQEAERLSRSDRARAVVLLRTAEAIDPRLPGLREAYDRLSETYPVVLVGMAQLPEHLSPALARTDADRWASDLIFEGLVKPVHDPLVGQRWEPALAARLPEPQPLAREFHVVAGACWSDGQPVTAHDVRRTIQMRKSPSWLGRPPEWCDWLGEARVLEPLRLEIRFQRGFIEPLALLTFPILPAHRIRQIDDHRLDDEPVGSGPYQFAGRRSETNPVRESAVFQANPYYAGRAGKQGRPRLREVRFVRSLDPRAEFQTGRLHLLLDIPTQKLQSLLSPEAGLDNVAIHTLRRRRVWFLAVNHRRTVLQNPDLRRAIALAIDREKLLADSFRAPDQPEKFHRWLNGPFPRGSWPAHPDLDRDDPNSAYYPYQPARAKALAQQARAAGTRLSLRFPSDDGRVRQAMEYLRSQVETHTGIELELRPRTPRQLRQEVEMEHDFDLAYWWWDFEDETYSLWPLFDPRATDRGGRNVLGYTADDQLQALFRRALEHRQFSVVRGLMHEIHAHLFEKMPLIPLWELDFHLAMSKDLHTVPAPEHLDPLRPFAQIDEWRLTR